MTETEGVTVVHAQESGQHCIGNDSDMKDLALSSRDSVVGEGHSDRLPPFHCTHELVQLRSLGFRAL